MGIAIGSIEPTPGGIAGAGAGAGAPAPDADRDADFDDDFDDDLDDDFEDDFDDLDEDLDALADADCDADVAGCGPEPDAGGVLVYGAGSGGCVLGLGILAGRPAGVTELPGSVGTRGAASIMLREIERLLSRFTETRLCGSGKCGAAGSFSASPRRLVFATEAEWMLPALAGRR